MTLSEQMSAKDQNILALSVHCVAYLYAGVFFGWKLEQAHGALMTAFYYWLVNYQSEIKEYLFFKFNLHV